MARGSPFPMPDNEELHFSPPPVAFEVPVTFRVGAVGFGVGVGCGAGVGFGRSFNLGSIPALGQAAQGISAGLGGLSGMMGGLGGAGSAVQHAVRGLGIRGLDAGFGCGVGLGYGFGAGLMLRPSFLEQTIAAGTSLLGQLTQAAGGRLQQAGLPVLPQAAAASSGSNSRPLGERGGPPQQVEMRQDLWTGQQPAAGAAAPGSTLSIGNGAAPSLAVPAVQQPSAGEVEQQQHANNGLQQLPPDPLVLRTLLQLQGDVAQLRKQNKQLRRAVCELNPRAPLCHSSSGSLRAGIKQGPRSRWLKAGSSSDGFSSDSVF